MTTFVVDLTLLDVRIGIGTLVKTVWSCVTPHLANLTLWLRILSYISIPRSKIPSPVVKGPVSTSLLSWISSLISIRSWTRIKVWRCTASISIAMIIWRQWLQLNLLRHWRRGLRWKLCRHCIGMERSRRNCANSSRRQTIILMNLRRRTSKPILRRRTSKPMLRKRTSKPILRRKTLHIHCSRWVWQRILKTFSIPCSIEKLSSKLF